MPKTFGQCLREKLDEAAWTPAELSRRADVTKQNISRILNDTPHPITGAPPKVEEATVEKLARPLNWDLNEARLAAGYAPASLQKPTNLKELIEALEFLGLPVPQLHGGFEKLVEDSGGFEEALQRIYLDLTLVLRRHETGGKVTFMELPLTEEGEKRKWK